MDIIERFLNYTKFDTQSAEDSATVPSTEKQLTFAKYLKRELEQEGLSDVEMDDKGYLYATLRSNTRQQVPTIGFISHYDTSPDSSGAGVKAQIVRDYDGSDILLSEGIVSSPKRFPELLQHVGEDLIVTDGTTLLGADDKAGIAEIVEAMCWLRDHPEVKHGDIRVAFNPDEEIGMGAQHFDCLLYTSPRSSVANGPIRWMAATWASWSLRTSTLPRPRSRSRVSACIPAMPRARW